VSELCGSIVNSRHRRHRGDPAHRRVRSARTWTARGEALDHFLLDRAARGPQPSPEVGRAWQLLVNSIGATPIKAIARHVGWSHKHLITKFKQQIGVTPHVAARSCLSKVWRHLDDERSWAQIAEFTGTTPGALVTARDENGSEVKVVQDGPGASPAPWVHVKPALQRVGGRRRRSRLVDRLIALEQPGHGALPALCMRMLAGPRRFRTRAAARLGVRTNGTDEVPGRLPG
jgi:AraC-like DNA-binding protein